MTKPQIRDLASVMQWNGSFSESTVDLYSGEVALDALSHATAEELLSAFKGSLADEEAKLVVGILLDAGLTMDSTLDFMGGVDAR